MRNNVFAPVAPFVAVGFGQEIALGDLGRHCTGQSLGGIQNAEDFGGHQTFRNRDKPRHHVVGPQRLLQQLRDADQDHIPRQVSIGVVDVAQQVQIAHGHDQLPAQRP